MKRYQLLVYLLFPTLLLSQSMTKIIAQLPNEETIHDNIQDDRVAEEKRIPLNITNWDALGLDRLEDYYNDFKYFASTKQVHHNYTILIIERDYDSEAYHWVLLLDKQHQIIDHLVSAYDNAEGFCATKSTIEDSKITLFESNIYEIPEDWESHYTIESTGFKNIAPQFTVTAPSGLTIRNQPSTAGTKLMIAPYGVQLTLFADTKIPFTVLDNGKTIQGNWMKVVLPSKIQNSDYSDYTEGFVFGGYLKPVAK